MVEKPVPRSVLKPYKEKGVVQGYQERGCRTWEAVPLFTVRPDEREGALCAGTERGLWQQNPCVVSPVPDRGIWVTNDSNL